MSPPICSWFCDNNIREIGYHKLAHLEGYEVTILPYLTPYWRDFAPFAKDLIMAGFPVKACLSNDFQYNQILQILNTAYDSVGEPQVGHISRILPMASKVFGAQRPTMTRIPKRVSNSSDRDFKKGRHF
jgi:hypothetical protein